MSSTYSDGKDRRASQVLPIEILGVTFTIRTDEDPDYIEGLVEELKQRLSAISSQMKIVDPLKLALVGNLLVLDELRRGNPRGTAESRDFEAENLIRDIDRKLGELGL
jgi:cell division protein ZapA (FtsZ GTPase activity inhibitor)